jgi:hypothetical protein
MIMQMEMERKLIFREQISRGVDLFKQHWRMIAIYALLAVFALNTQFISLVSAQTETPPVGLDINMDPVFTQTNYWTEQLFPIMAIGIGISIAMALIAFIGSAIVKAFRGG